MDSKQKLQNIISIIKRGKKPIRESVFFPGLDDLYVFKGGQYTYEEMQQIITEYENPEMPIIIWHERRTYPETQPPPTAR